MKLLLKKNVPDLGIVGDVVKVSSGYARNFLLPHDLATEPTKGNMRALAEDRKRAEERLLEEKNRRRAIYDKLQDVEITVAAAANEEGVLYGSVGPREIAAALREEGIVIDANWIRLHQTIRHIDTVKVPIRVDQDLEAEVKVWVVRARGEGEEEEDDQVQAAGDAGDADDESQYDAGMEAGDDGESTDD